jgi:hypothetical protein
MTFPVGVWTLSANNDTGTLTINSVALATGGAPFGGTVAFAQGGSFPIVGLLDETTRAFNFLLIDSSTSPPSYQSYTGTAYPASVETTTSFDFVTVMSPTSQRDYFRTFPIDHGNLQRECLHLARAAGGLDRDANRTP